MPNSDPRESIVYPIHKMMIDYYNLRTEIERINEGRPNYTLITANFELQLDKAIDLGITSIEDQISLSIRPV